MGSSIHRGSDIQQSAYCKSFHEELQEQSKSWWCQLKYRDRRFFLPTPRNQLSTMASDECVTFQIMSDLHLEFGTGYNSFHIRPGAPFLCLLADIGLAIHEEKLFRFLERQLKSFKIVFFLLGNHETYSSSYPFAKAVFTSFRQQCEEKRKVDKSLGEFVFWIRLATM